MKFKTTKKALKGGYYHIIGIGYCNAQHLLNYENPDSYCAGANGWNCDNYDVNGILISTGYDHVNNQNTSYDYEKLRAYETKAQAIQYNYNLKWEDQKAQIRALLNEFIQQSKKEIV